MLLAIAGRPDTFERVVIYRSDTDIGFRILTASESHQCCLARFAVGTYKRKPSIDYHITAKELFVRLLFIFEVEQSGLTSPSNMKA